LRANHGAKLPDEQDYHGLRANKLAALHSKVCRCGSGSGSGVSQLTTELLAAVFRTGLRSVNAVALFPLLTGPQCTNCAIENGIFRAIIRLPP
jgi:hypothetical protein